MASITTADVRAFVAKRQERKASSGEINRELTALKRMFSLAMQAGKLLHRPHIPMLAEHNVRNGFFELQQFALVLSKLRPGQRLAAKFAYLTGWRLRSEVLNSKGVRSISRQEKYALTLARRRIARAACFR